MKKLVCILIVIAIIMSLNVTIFANCPFAIRPKNAEPLPGQDDLYYGYVDIKDLYSNDTLNYTAIAEYDVTNVRIEPTGYDYGVS